MLSPVLATGYALEMLKLAIASLALITAASAQAQSSDTGRREAQPPVAEDAAGSEVKCRSIFQVNSRIPERICRTKAEWDQIARDSREALERNQRGRGASGDVN